MSIPLSSNFLLAAGLPLDDRTVVADITERDAIDNVKRYEGLTVYLESDASTYQLQGGITNSDWVLLASSFVDPNTNNVVAVKVATTTILPNSPLYDNGSGGVGATLQPATEGAIGNIDGIPILLLDRILVKNQSNPIENGIYFVDEVGDVSTQYRLVRADDSDETSELNEQIVSPSKGTANKGRLFSQQTVNPTVGSNNIVYAQVSGVFVTQAGTGTQILGQVPWWNTAIRQLSRGTSSFVWDITNSRLGIGTSTPVEKLHVAGGTARIENGGGSLAGFAIRNNSASFDNAVTVGGLGNMNVYGNFNIYTNAQSDVTKPTWNMRIRTDLDRIEFMRVPAGGSVLTEVGQLALSSPGLLGVGLGTGIVATAYVHAAPSTTANASVRIPAGVAPTSPLQGDIWQASNHLFYRSNDGNTYQLDQQTVGGVFGTGSSGQVTFWTGTSTVSGSSNLFWDNTNSRLGIGTNSPSAPVHLIKDSIGITSTDGLILSNTTAATNVLNQFSPRIRLIGQGWKTASTAGSQQVEWMMELQAQTGTNNPTSNLFFYRQANLGGLVEQMKFIQGPGGDRADFFIGSITTDKTITIGNGNGLNCSGQVTSNNFSANAAKSGLLTNIIATTATTLSRYLFASATSINYNLLLGGTDSKTPQVGESAASFISGEVNITKNGSGTHELFANTVFKPIAVTNNTSSLTNTATVYIEDASSATVTGANLALWVDAGISRFDGDIKLNDAGNGLYIKEGTNATMGIATLVAGTVTVNTTKVTANSRIFLTVNGGTLTNVGAQYVSARTAGTSFTITSLNVLDTSQTAWMIVEPA